MHKEKRMVLEGREREIFDILQKRDKVTVRELAQILFVSEMTVRRDLTSMQRQGLVKRFRGGALLNTGDISLPVAHRIHIEEGEKRNLAARAARYLRDGQSVFIDSSSTCCYLIAHLKKYKDIRLFTNSVSAIQMASELHIDGTLYGGAYYVRDMCCVGPLAEAQAECVSVDVAFFSSLGYSDDGVISDEDLPQTAMRRAVMKNAKQNVFLFEKRKLHKKLLYTLCTKEDATEIFTTEE